MDIIVSITVYLPHTQSTLIPQPSSNTTVHSLSTHLTAISSFIQRQSLKYIWHKEIPHFAITNNSITATVNVGECLDDEAYLTYLAILLTTQLPTKFIVEIHDNDGQFLLIEAANSLPTWVNPETVSNRVFIYEANLHLIPIPVSPAQIPVYPAGDLSIESALSLVLNPSIQTQAPNSLQLQAFEFIKEYPLKGIQNTQRVACYVHPDILQILHHLPQLVTLAIDCFCNRDPSDMKVASNLSTFNTTETSTVKSTIHLTKMSFALLSNQKFFSPKSYQMPLDVHDPHYYQHDLGMKLTCAFEMLVKNKSYQRISEQNKLTLPTVDTYSFSTDPKWIIYEAKLNTFGYFKEELKGSILYNALLKDAKESFLKTLPTAAFSDDPISAINEILSNKMKSLDQIISNEPEDSLDWMTRTSDDLDFVEDQLNEDDFGLNDEDEEHDDTLNEEDQEDLRNLDKIVNGFKAFVERESDVNGVTFPADHKTSQDESVELNPDLFIKTMMDIFGMSQDSKAAPSDNGHDSDESVCDSDLDSDDGIEEAMACMDRELSHTNIGKDFRDDDQVSSHIQDQEDILKMPINIDANLVKNLLASLDAQEGMAGPMQSIVKLLGANIPTNKLK